MSAEAILLLAANVTLGVLSLALIMTVIRLVLGPTLPDRIVALDLLVGIVMGFIAAFSIRTGVRSYLDIAIALGLVGFLATVAFARYVLWRGQAGDAPATLPDGDESPLTQDKDAGSP
ncbi:cation:proton antiporter [Oryzibacter oryziterrae]|uniref:cation:proton antiporter n=1 Tax=Oryzibacter oryziterrae TaxID=2766474 RepID=UPI001F0C720F|nr:cation:proton antiporter [Oryzibacter oryziterrae]